jgi:RNA ligase (TIGR02306 family)
VRKLASIQKIVSVEAIEGKDRIVQCGVLGWSMVTQKSNNFQVGDYCVFFEIDSILPEAEWSAFLEGKTRIRTRKFGGVLAQGLMLPIDAIPEVESHLRQVDGDIEGLDLTELLGVIQWEPPVDANTGESRGNFPTHIISKTDEIRIQSCPKVLEELKGLPWYAALKMDGSSATYFWDDAPPKMDMSPGFVSCSRNMRKSEDSHFHQVALRYGLDEILKTNDYLVFQGEVVGPGIQANRLGLKELDLFIFNVYDRREKRYLTLSEALQVCKFGKLKHVPIIDQGESFDLTQEALVQMSIGEYEGTKNPREGIVVRPQTPVYSNVLRDRLSFKVVNPNYLLKYE